MKVKNIPLLLLFLIFGLCSSTICKGQTYDELVDQLLTDYRKGNYKESISTLNSVIDTLAKSDHKRQVRCRYIQISIYCYLDSCKAAKPSYDYLRALAIDNDTIDASRLDALSYFSYKNEDFKQAIELYNQSFEQYQKIGNHDSAIKALIMRSMCENYLYQKEASMETLHFADHILDSIKLKGESISNYRKFQIYNEIGNVLNSVGDVRGAESYFLKALTIDSLAAKHVATANGNLTQCYLQLKEYDKCIDYCNRIVKDEKVRLSTRVYAYSDLIEALIYSEELDHARVEIESMRNIISDTTSLFYKNVYTKAHGNFLIADKQYNSGLKRLRSGYNYICQEYPEKRKSRLAFAKDIIKGHYQRMNNAIYTNDFSEYQASLDTIHYWNQKNEVQAATVRFETKAKQDSIQLLSLELDNKRVHVNNNRLAILSLLLGVFSIGLLAFQYRLKYKGQREENQELIFQNEELKNMNGSLESKIETLNAQYETSDVKVIQYKSGDKVYTIEHPEVSHIVAEQNGCRIFIGDKSQWTDRTLKSFHNELGDYSFVQVHRSTIVNVTWIHWVNHVSLMLKNDTQIKIGRSYKERIKTAIKN